MWNVGDPGAVAVREKIVEHRMGFEPMNTGFADQRVSHFAIGAHFVPPQVTYTACNPRSLQSTTAKAGGYSPGAGKPRRNPPGLGLGGFLCSSKILTSSRSSTHRSPSTATAARGGTKSRDDEVQVHRRIQLRILGPLPVFLLAWKPFAPLAICFRTYFQGAPHVNSYRARRTCRVFQR
jgi:hypothetical protein